MNKIKFEALRRGMILTDNIKIKYLVLDFNSTWFHNHKTVKLARPHFEDNIITILQHEFDLDDWYLLMR